MYKKLILLTLVLSTTMANAHRVPEMTEKDIQQLVNETTCFIDLKCTSTYSPRDLALKICDTTESKYFGKDFKKFDKLLKLKVDAISDDQLNLQNIKDLNYEFSLIKNARNNNPNLRIANKVGLAGAAAGAVIGILTTRSMSNTALETAGAAAFGAAVGGAAGWFTVAATTPRSEHFRVGKGLEYLKDKEKLEKAKKK